jgi:hypothetical protein
MYPIPDIYSQRTLIPRDSPGAAIGQLLRTSPQLLRLAQQSYGFRYSNPERFQQIVGHFRFFGRKIVVPLLFEPARAPVPSVLEDIINATVTPSPPHSTASTC